jgi:hypothetical protein
MDTGGKHRDDVKKLLQSSPCMMPMPQSGRRLDSDFNKNLGALERLTQSMQQDAHNASNIPAKQVSQRV